MGNILIAVCIGFMAGFAVAGVIAIDIYTHDSAVVSEQQCNIDKPSGTVCEWVSTWQAVEVK